MSINIGSLITSENADFAVFFTKTTNVINSGTNYNNTKFLTAAKMGIFPKVAGQKMNVEKLEVAFGISDWAQNTAPQVFSIQYTNDGTASVSDAATDARWTILKRYTSWYQGNGIVTIPAGISCIKMRLVVEAKYYDSYYNITQFRLYGDVVQPSKLLLQSEGKIKTFDGSKFVDVGDAPVTEEMFLKSSFSDASVISGDLWKTLKTPKILAYSTAASQVNGSISAPATLYDQTSRCYIGIGTIETEEEAMPTSRKGLIISAEHTGCTFQFSADGGVSWNAAALDTIIDLSSLKGNRLRIRINLPATTAKLNAISYAWA